MKRIFEKINFRQPKYMLPAILYIPLLGASYLVFDLFNVEKAEIPDNTLQATEFLNPELPDATIKGGDGIGSKYENMAKSWGKIADYTAVDNVEREEPDDDREKYESRYSQDEVAFLGEQEQQKLQAGEFADVKAREREALEELERALAGARLKGAGTSRKCRTARGRQPRTAGGNRRGPRAERSTRTAGRSTLPR